MAQAAESAAAFLCFTFLHLVHGQPGPAFLSCSSKVLELLEDIAEGDLSFDDIVNEGLGCLNPKTGLFDSASGSRRFCIGQLRGWIDV
jgi:hypothetical protein